VVRDAFEQVPVAADDEHAGEGVEEVLHRRERVDVQVVRRPRE
jgi:hypothetical protein